jgi:hypothetical protein
MGTFNDPNILHPAYTPGANDVLTGYVVLKLTAFAQQPCESFTDSLALTITKQATVNAGEDNTFCEGEQMLLTDASAENYSSLTWSTSGTGSFSNPFIMDPVYAPTPDDIQQGSVVLTLTASSLFPCAEVSDPVILTFSKAPVADAGPDGSVCMDIPFYVTGAGAEKYSALKWTSNGTGTLTGSTTLSPTYMPAPGESGNIILTLLAYGNSACSDTFATDQMNIRIYDPPYADAGEDQVIKSGTPASLTGTAEGGSGFYSYIWEPSELFTDNTGNNPVTVKLTSDTIIFLTVTDLVSG